MLFFIDRDLSAFLNERLPKARNLYVTDKYSIENDMVSRDTCDRMLTEVCNLSSLAKKDKDQILDLFDTQLGAFQGRMTPIMAHIILWRRSGKKPSLDNIRMRHLYGFKSGKLVPRPSPKGFSDHIEYIYNQCKLDRSFRDVADVEKEFGEAEGPTKFVRGKYELWFLIEFVLSICRDIGSLGVSISAPPRMSVSLGMHNALLLVGPRARVPKSLKVFLETTCFAYIQRHQER